MDLEAMKQKETIIFDGAMGTYLSQKYKLNINRCETQNLEDKEKVLSVHREYIAAGADAIKTNTFAANTAAMGTDLATVFSVIDAGCELAKEAVKNTDVMIFASIGPIMHDNQEKCDEERELLIKRFLKNGIQNFLFETYDEYEVLQRAAKTVKHLQKTAFVICECTVAPDKYTASGQAAQTIINHLYETKEIDAYGFNCTCGPLHLLDVARSVDFYDRPVCMMPNAGYPTVINNRTVFKSTPDYFAEQLQKMKNEGVKFLGGCCGTTPQHIKAAKNLIERSTTAHREVRVFAPKIKKQENEKRLSGEKTIAVELDSPMDADNAFFIDAAKMLAHAGADIITIADCPIGRARADSSMLSAMLKAQYGIEAMPHLTCRDRNLNASKALLLGLSMQNISNVLVVTGDPIPTNKRTEIKSVYNFNAVKYAAFINDLNDTTFGEKPFTIMGALNVNAQNFEAELQKAKKKETAGVSVFLTQPIYEQAAKNNLKLAKKELKADIWAGIMPIVSYKNACFINNEVAGISIPEEICALYQGKDRQQATQIAIDITYEIAKETEKIADGFYIITPLKRVDIVCELIRKIKGEKQ
ncbi:MAG: bifunctional homocysteine S-methyltransferase/methylenetetrahydrofolate reductase [Christensenellaceae bacterium]